ncbi:GntR family transcriptional regulator [Limimaricola litoreus]
MTTQEYVHARLRNAIMVGAVQPESTLTIRGLAEYLELSPTPVREALRRLSSERAIELLGNRRISIPVMTAPRLEEILRLRMTLECHAARRALPFVSEVLIDRMRAIDDRMDDYIQSRDLDALTISNHEFHRVLYTANPHQTVLPVIESVWLQLGPFQRQMIRALEQFYLIDRHKEILTALRERDAAALALAIEADIEDGIGRAGREVLQAGQPESETHPAAGWM